MKQPKIPHNSAYVKLKVDEWEVIVRTE